MNVIIDSSILIDFTRSKKGYLPEILALKTDLFIPTVVVAELWSGKSMSDKKEANIVEKMLRGFKVVDLNKDIAKMTGGLLRTNQVSQAFDAVIAATALYLDAELATANKKHFEKVRGLKLFNPQKY